MRVNKQVTSIPEQAEQIIYPFGGCFPKGKRNALKVNGRFVPDQRNPRDDNSLAAQTDIYPLEGCVTQKREKTPSKKASSNTSSKKLFQKPPKPPATLHGLSDTNTSLAFGRFWNAETLKNYVYSGRTRCFQLLKHSVKFHDIPRSSKIVQRLEIS